VGVSSWGFHVPEDHAHSESFPFSGNGSCSRDVIFGMHKVPVQDDERLLSTKYLSPARRFLNNVELQADPSYFSVDDMSLNSCFENDLDSDQVAPSSPTCVDLQKSFPMRLEKVHIIPT
jgi:hypothetical protein